MVFWQHAVHFCAVTALEMLGILSLQCLGLWQEIPVVDMQLQSALKPTWKLLSSSTEQYLWIVFSSESLESLGSWGKACVALPEPAHSWLKRCQ